MKKYYFLRIVGVIFLLCCFQPNASAAAASAVEAQPNHTFSSLAARRALENIQKYLDFEQDYLDFAEKSRSSDDCYFYNVWEINENISDLKEEREFINGLKIDEKSLDLMLRHFLERRFRILDLRQALFHARRYVDDGTERMKQKDASQVTMCQFYDQLIADIYHLTSPEHLSYRTRWLIRLSQALWPLLMGETEELSHPDLAVYGKLGDKSSIGRGCDFDLYKTYEEKSVNYVFELKGLGVPKGSKIVMQISPYEKSQVDPTYRKIRDLHYAEWLNVLLKKAEVRVPLPTNQQAKKSVEKPKAEAQTVAASAASSYGSSRQDSLAEVLLNMQQDTATPKDVPQEDEPEDAEVVSQSRIDGKSTLAISLKEEKQVRVQRVMPRGMRMFHSRDQRTFRTTFTDLSGYTDMLRNLFGDESQFVPIKYRDFASLWRAIVGIKISGGKDIGKNTIRESTGSSHKALLDADGRVVTGIFAHNNNMECTRRTLPYLRYAIEMLGVFVD